MDFYFTRSFHVQKTHDREHVEVALGLRREGAECSVSESTPTSRVSGENPGYEYTQLFRNTVHWLNLH